jgi:hypothetical protein
MTVQPMTVAELVRNIETGWNTFQTYIRSLSADQLTKPTDAAGWTAKDHIIHLASWEDTLNALLEHTPQWERLGVDKALWDSHDVDKINAIVQKRYQNMPLEDVLLRQQQVHYWLMSKVPLLSDEELQRPVRDYQMDTDDTRPILQNLVTDTYEAYEEHTPWIAAIVAKENGKAAAQQS